jgi:tetratricopeptide (TPR) repeat protein
VVPEPAGAPTDHTHFRTLVVAVAPLSAEAGAAARTLPIRPDTRWDEDAPPPQPGERVAGFRLVEQLGRGSFARVFLAEQEAIANRRVVLKIADAKTPEADRLGRLLHPNVVPIHSVHRDGSRFAICMPFLGRRTLADHLAGRRPAPDGRPGPAPRSELRWVLRILSALAGGLDHAHRRGVLHLDVKPANVLLADSGEPMLLDFNLARDTTLVRGLTGGTLPYMAPEQVADMVSGGRGALDERTDLFSLGVLAFELLTGRHPFPTGMGTGPAGPAGVPAIRDKNPAVSPAVESIVRKLLAPDPAGRYQTALELKTDLDRQLADQPLAAAADPSPWERARKWRRRNAPALVRVAAAVVLGLWLGAVVQAGWRAGAADQTAAVARAAALRERMAAVRIDLGVPGDRAAHARGVAAAEDELARFGLLGSGTPGWENRPPFAHLPDDLKPAVAADLGELLLLVAHARWREAVDAPPAERAVLLGEAIRLNAAAGGCFPPGTAPPFLALQRATLTATEPGEVDAPQTPRDHFLDAVRLIAAGDDPAALRALDRAHRADPSDPAVYFAEGYCRHRRGQLARALARYETAHALLPTHPRPVFDAGVTRGFQTEHALAEEKFTEVIRLDPGNGEAHRNRALARLQLAPPKARDAERDLTAALEWGVSPVQVYVLRAQAREALGDARGAERDRRAATQHAPRTEGDFLARGRSRLPTDPAGALADFEAAARLNPSSLAALQNQAHVLAAYLHDPERSLAVATRAAELCPEYPPARAARAALLTRRGRAGEARAEVAAAARLAADLPADRSPATDPDANPALAVEYAGAVPRPPDP